MNLNKIGAVLCIAGALLVSLTGCATTNARKGAMASETKELRSKVNALERELRTKDELIYQLEAENKELSNAQIVKMPKLVKKEIKPSKPAAKTAADNKISSGISKPAPKEIQIALKKAGFYKDAIDGKIKTNTKRAIKEFQRSNGLKVDGVVGEKTWAKLKLYL